MSIARLVLIENADMNKEEYPEVKKLIEDCCYADDITIMNDNEKAAAYFNQARECYEKWGSSVKVDFVQRELYKLCK